MSFVQRLVTEDSFDAQGVLVPAGHIGTFDTERLNGDEKHLHDASEIEIATVEMAAIGPSGPNPRIPQQIPPGAVQDGAGNYTVPGKVLVGEVTDPAETRIDDAGLRDPDKEAETSEKLAEIMGRPPTATLNNEDDALVAGTVKEVTANLGAKTDDELTTLRAAEQDREKPRAGVLTAIDEELDARKPAA